MLIADSGRLLELSSKSRPQQVKATADACQADHGHPDAGYDMDAALGQWTDATPLAPTAAQECVEAEGEGDEADDDEEEASGERERHGISAPDATR